MVMIFVSMKQIPYFGYITTPTQKVARDIAKALLEKNCIACANIMPGAQSMFWWNGKVHQEKECLLFIKTTSHRVQDVLDEVENIHPYECPCVSFFPIIDGNADYLEWVCDEVR